MSQLPLGIAVDSLTLIVEPNPGGHRLHYVGILVEECHAQGDKVVVLTTATAVESAEWRIHLDEQAPKAIIQYPKDFQLPDIASVAARIGATNTILPDADGHLISALRHGWVGPGMLTLLVMRADVQPGPPLAWMQPAKTLVKRALILVAGCRPGIRVFALRSPLVPRRGPLRWIAEPVKLSGSSQQTYAMREKINGDESRYWLGVFGAITPRKNLPLVIESILDQPDIGLLIAGSVDPQVSKNIAPLLAKFIANGGKVHHMPGPLTDVEFDSAIGAVDCVVAAHSNEGPSNVVLKAVASGRRLVLAGAKSLRQDAAHLKGQATWCNLNVNSLRRAIRQARSLPEPAAVEPSTDEFVKALTQT